MKKKYKLSLIIFSILFVLIFLLLRLSNPSELIENYLKIVIHNHQRLDRYVFRTANLFFIIYIIIITYVFLKDKVIFENYMHKFRQLILHTNTLLTLNLLLIIIIIYLCILYILAINNYDLGIDEAGQVLWARNFATYGFPIVTWNQQNSTFYFFPIDNVQMLPMYLLSFPFIKLGLNNVWAIKLIGTIASIISLIVIYYVVKKQYSFKFFISFLFLLAIQPGFGFVTSSFFSETMQSALILLTIYIWLKDSNSMSRKKIILISLLFAFVMHTKLQPALIILISLIIFHYINKEKKSLHILVYTIIFSVVIGIIRFIPAILYDSSFLYKQVKAYIFLTGLNGSTFSLDLYINKLRLFDRFFPILIISIIFVSYYFYKKNTFEKFLYIYSFLMALWWIFLFPYSTYRHLMMFIIPFILLLCTFMKNLYEDHIIGFKDKIPYLRLLITTFIILLMFNGFLTNIIYAIKGNNDAVQFDLDGSKSIYTDSGELRFSLHGVTDNSQKVFFNKIKKILKPQDTIYNPTFVTNAYLSNPMAFLSTIQNFDTGKYIIIGRDAYPLGLDQGYKMIDSLKLQKDLIYKYGEFELYSIHK
jgi:hypothetical protein